MVEIICGKLWKVGWLGVYEYSGMVVENNMKRGGVCKFVWV